MSRFPGLVGRQSGMLDVQRGRLVFTYDNDPSLSHILNTHQLMIELGGKNSPHYYLKDPLQPENVICVQDPKVLELLALHGVPSARDTLKKSKIRTTTRLAALGTPFLVIGILILLLPFFLSLVPLSWFEKILSAEQEAKLGRWALSSFAPELAKSEKAEKALAKLVERIQGESEELRNLDIQVYISKSKDINAAALPGGIIVMNSELLKTAGSVEEIAGVLAHEIGHVERRHSMKSLAGGIGYMTGLVLLSVFIGSDASQVLASGSNLLSLKFSRLDESEADAKGFEFLKNAKIPAQGLVTFLDRMEKIEGSSSVVSKATAVLRTHPLSADRVQNLQKLISAEPYQTQGFENLKLQDFQQDL